MRALLLPIALLAASLVLSGCDQQPAESGSQTPPHVNALLGETDGVPWFEGSLEVAFKLARAENKPVFVYWGAEWCPYCEALRTTVFTRPDFIEQSRHFVPISLNGDLPEAQKWGTEFKVVGYPTMLIFRPDRTEIARVSGGMDLTKYASVLERVLQDERPIADVLAAATGSAGTTPTEASGPVISAGDCRRLAYHAWDLKGEDENEDENETQRNLNKLATDLTTTSARCPTDEVAARARLSMHALGFALTSESEAIEEGKPASTALTQRVRALSLLLADGEQVRGAIDIIVSLDSALYKVVKSQGTAFTDSFWNTWVSAMLKAARDANYGEGERLLATANALDGTKELRSDHAIPRELAENARKQIAAALNTDRDTFARTDIVNAARIVYTVLEDDQAAYDMLVREIPKSTTPYYYMPSLAAIEEKRGQTTEALWWLERAYASTQTPGAKARWGSTYIRGLIRLAPDDVARIEKVALEVAQAINERDAQIERSPDRAARLTDSLEKWATTPTRKAVAAVVAEHLDPLQTS